MAEKKFEVEYDGQTLKFEARRLLFREQEHVTNEYLEMKGVNSETGKPIIETKQPHQATAYQLAVAVIKPWFDCADWGALTDQKRREAIMGREAAEVGAVFAVWNEFNNLTTEKKLPCDDSGKESDRRE